MRHTFAQTFGTQNCFLQDEPRRVPDIGVGICLHFSLWSLVSLERYDVFNSTSTGYLHLVKALVD